MLYRLTSILVFTAFIMIESVMSFIKYAASNMEQFAFIFSVEKADPFLGAALGLQYFFPLLFLIICLAAACFATQLSIQLIEWAVWVLDATVEFSKKCYRGKFQNAQKH